MFPRGQSAILPERIIDEPAATYSHPVHAAEMPMNPANTFELSLLNVQRTGVENPPDVRCSAFDVRCLVRRFSGALAIVALCLKSALADPALPVIPSGVYNITNYGAIGDGIATNTAAIQAAITAAASSAQKGGTIEIPPGTYLSGPFSLKSSINLQVDSGALLQMLPRSQWPGTSTFINGSSLHDVEISGAGTIDGQGGAWWLPKASSRPNFINFSGCNRILIQDVTLQNPPTFHLMLKGNNVNLTIRRITINTPGNSPNTDGMDVASTNMLVQDCYISDGDDNIEIGGSQAAAFIVITNCFFGNGHGVSMGSIVSGGVSDVTVINCNFSGTQNGIRLKSDNDRGGIVQNLAYLNIGMTNVGIPITLYSYYNEVGTPDNITPATAAGEPVAAVSSTTPVWNNILISNLTATATSGQPAGIIWSRTELPATNVILDKVNITAPQSFDIYNAYGVQIIDSTINVPGGVNTIELYNAGITFTNSGPAAAPVTLDGLTSVNSLELFNAAAAITASDALGFNPITIGAGTLTVSNDLALPDTAVVNFAVGTSPSLIAVTGNLSLASTLNMTNAAGFGPGTNTLFAYDGTLTGVPVLGATPAGSAYLYQLDTTTAGRVNFIVSAPPPPPPPVIGKIVASGGDLVISGAGGTTNGTYYVLTSTNVALPLDQWTPVATNRFDTAGNFVFTNSPASGLQGFFRLSIP